MSTLSTSCSTPHSTPTGPCAVRWLGRVPYRETISAMENHVEAKHPDALWLLEHDPILTLGKSTKPGHIRATNGELGLRGVEVLQSTRGGDVTFHGPGQLVGYPIVNIRNRRLGARCYVAALEEAIIGTVGHFGLAAGRIEGRTGVWVNDEKIAAIGVRISRGITSHGFALNVATDLSYFDLIVPCGIADAGVTSIEALVERSVSLAEVVDVFVDQLGSQLRSEMTWQTPKP